MNDLLRILEEERRKLNELGKKSLEQSIPLSDNQEVQEQSRKVDELMLQYQQMKTKHKQTGGREQAMGFPAWFRQAIQSRLDDVSVQIEYHPELRKIRDEEDEAFHAIFDDLKIAQTAEFANWEDKYILKQSMMNERLYMQGLRDGIQLATEILNHSASPDHETRSQSNREKAEGRDEAASTGINREG